MFQEDTMQMLSHWATVLVLHVFSFFHVFLNFKEPILSESTEDEDGNDLGFYIPFNII